MMYIVLFWLIEFCFQFSFDWIVFDSMDCGMDLIVLIWLKLDTLLLIEIISILNTINVSIQIGYIVYDMVDNNG
jgi:hypothetical protein